MKKLQLSIFIIAIGLVAYFIFSPTSKSSFVSINDENKFELHGEEFYPLAVNYCASLQTDGEIFWVRPHNMYNVNNSIDVSTRESGLKQFKADMELIKSMGFNSIRLCKVGEERVDKKNGDRLSIPIHTDETHRESFTLTDNPCNYDKYFEAMDEMFEIIEDAGLKVVLLIRMVPHSKSTKNHLKRLAAHFKHNNTLMAYDLFNEPLYFDTIIRSKPSVVYEVNIWDGIVNKFSKHHHLTTLGLEGIREVFEWDPNLINVDFYSFHPYQYEPEQVRNEIYWYGKYIKKPWMIGETSIPANNDSITYEEQKLFAENTLKQTLNCGGIGYTWWQFKDVMGMKYHDSYMGVIDMKGNTKPAAQAFKSFVPEKNDTCLCFDNYYNYSQNDSFALLGKMVNENNEPIQGAVILGWNKWWTHSYHTVTKKDGSFKLLGDYDFYHWMSSATEHTMTRGEVPLHLKVDSIENSIPYVDLGVVKVEKIEFAPEKNK